MGIASIGSAPADHDDDADNDDSLSGVYIELSHPHLQLDPHLQQHERRKNEKRRHNLRYPTCATGVVSAAIASEPLSWWRSYPRMTKLIAITAISGVGLASIHLLTSSYRQYYTRRRHPSVSTVAFLGNSMFYFNDFPRFFETIAGGRVVQNSCLHGGASIESLVVQGNAMYPQFGTARAIIGTNADTGDTIYDYGACTVRQLLNGDTYDPDADEEWRSAIDDNNQASPPSNNTNPCRVDYAYLEYANSYFRDTNMGYWDYVVINDNTRNPARAVTRIAALSTLEEFYVPWLLETKSTPVFLWTHAYTYENTCMTDYADNLNVVMTGLEDIANFTSLTGVGYRAYVDLLNSYLPIEQAPRIAPVGLAYLVVHEENYEVWKTLFHCDNLHASPSGSFLQGCIIYYTLFGVMPSKDGILKEDMSILWDSARVMQHYWEPSNKFPDVETAMYLYRVAERVVKEGHIPSAFIDYQNGEVAFEGT